LRKLLSSVVAEMVADQEVLVDRLARFGNNLHN
jgi:hypothetical protein